MKTPDRKKRKKEGLREIDLNELLVLAVSQLVSAFADVMSDQDSGVETQAHFYRLLAANCAAKAKIAEGFAEQGRKTREELAQNERSKEAAQAIIEQYEVQKKGPEPGQK
jgi:hypothetical protein